MAMTYNRFLGAEFDSKECEDLLRLGYIVHYQDFTIHSAKNTTGGKLFYGVDKHGMACFVTEEGKIGYYYVCKGTSDV